MARKEVILRAKKDLESENYTVFPATNGMDLIAVKDKKFKLVKIMEFKKRKGREKHSIDRRKLEALEKLELPANATVEVWIWETNRGWHDHLKLGEAPDSLKTVDVKLSLQAVYSLCNEIPDILESYEGTNAVNPKHIMGLREALEKLDEHNHYKGFV